MSITRATTTTFSAKATDASSNTSACSQPFSYTEPSVVEVEPNDTLTQADGSVVSFNGSSKSLTGQIDPSDDIDVFKLVVSAGTDLRFRTTDSTGDGCTPPVDTVLTLKDAGGTEIESNDDLTPPSLLCSGFERSLAPGTYYLEVAGFAGASTTFGYALQLTKLPVVQLTGTSPASPAANNAPLAIGTATAGAQVEIFTRSTCAGTPAGTGAAAQLATGIPVSIGANRTRSVYARARSGSTIGLCTSSSLSFENTTGRPTAPLTEAEPNDTKVGAVLQGVNVTPGQFVAGTLLDGNDIDLYTLTIAAPQVIHLETFDTTAGDCPVLNFDTRLRLLANDATTQVAIDDDSGIASCDALTVELSAGTYYIEVTASTAPLGPLSYRVGVSAPANLSSESELQAPGAANNTPQQANPITLSSLTVGDHQSTDDEDWYRLTIVGVASVRAEVIESASPTETCESNGIDSRLELFAANGTTQLSDDDNGGRGRCSLVDGTGASPKDSGAFDLAPGTYYLRVTGAGSGSGAERSFNYRLAVGVR